MPIKVLVAESTDGSMSSNIQLANKNVPSLGMTIGASGLFTLTSMGPTDLGNLTCADIKSFDVVYIPGTSGTERDTIKNNPAFAQCFTSRERAVITGYHADGHSQPATGQFFFDSLTWISGGSQVGILVLNDFRQSPQKYDFIQPMFPGVYASVISGSVGYNYIIFLTIPPHPIQANTSDGFQHIGDPTMDNWNQTVHTIWNTFGLGGGGYEDDGFIAVSKALQAPGQQGSVCAIAKEGVTIDNLPSRGIPLTNIAGLFRK